MSGYMGDVGFESCRMSELRLSELMLDLVHISDTRIDDVRVTKQLWFNQCTLENVSISGEAKWPRFQEVVFRGVDLSGLRMVDGQFLDIQEADALLPQFADSFVIEATAYRDAAEEIRGRVSPAAYGAYDGLVRLGSLPYEAVDERSFDLTEDPELGEISPEERKVILEVLHRYRLRKPGIPASTES
jgi:hypothetical protein